MFGSSFRFTSGGSTRPNIAAPLCTFRETNRKGLAIEAFCSGVNVFGDTLLNISTADSNCSFFFFSDDVGA